MAIFKCSTNIRCINNGTSSIIDQKQLEENIYMSTMQEYSLHFFPILGTYFLGEYLIYITLSEIYVQGIVSFLVN